jgi:hypothetical protein
MFIKFLKLENIFFLKTKKRMYSSNIKKKFEEKNNLDIFDYMRNLHPRFINVYIDEEENYYLVDFNYTHTPRVYNMLTINVGQDFYGKVVNIVVNDSRVIKIEDSQYLEELIKKY